MAATGKTTPKQYCPTKNKEVIKWVVQIAELTKPDTIYWCDGTPEEYKQICQELVDKGTFIKLNPTKRPKAP